MVVYFNASVLGKKKYLEEFRLIVKTIKKLGHNLFSDQIMDRNYKILNQMTNSQHEADFQKVRNEIQKSDVMVVESTFPSVGVGYIMSIALQMYKPVLILYQTIPHGLLIGDPNRLLTIKRYSKKNPDQLKKIIETFMKKSRFRLLKRRFNFMIDKVQDDFVEWLSKKLAISKADYVRQLIDEKLRKDKEYKERLRI